MECGGRWGAAKQAYGGGRGIRTPDTFSGTTVFKTVGINHSPIPPLGMATFILQRLWFFDGEHQIGVFNRSNGKPGVSANGRLNPHTDKECILDEPK